MKSRLSLSLLLAVCIAFYSCVNEKTIWDKTKLDNTIQSYESFIEKYPEGVYSDSARLFIKLIDYKMAETTNTIEAFEEFIKKYPNDSLATKSESIIDNFWVVTDLSYSVVKSVSASCGFSEATMTAKEGHLITIHGNFSVAGNSNNSALLSDIKLAGNSSDSTIKSSWVFEPIAIGYYSDGSCSFFDFGCFLKGEVQVTLPSGLGYSYNKKDEKATGELSLVGKNVPLCIAFPASGIPNEDIILTIENRNFHIALTAKE